MGHISLGGFPLISWGKGNDRYTRTPIPNRVDPRFFTFNNKSEKWEIIRGRELELYATTGVLSIVLWRFASMFANGKLVHKKKDGTKEGKTIEDSPFIFMFDRPNPLQSGREFMIESCLHHFIFGNNIMLPLKNPESNDLARKLGLIDIPSAINNVRPDIVEITTTGKRWDQKEIDGIISKYTIDSGTDHAKIINPEDVIHMRRVDPANAVIGESVFSALHMEISNIRAAMGFRNVNLTEHGELGFYSPSGKDSVGNVSLTDDQRLEIEKQMTKTHGIFGGQAKKKLFNQSIDYTHTAYPISDSMTFEEISEDTKKVIDAVNLNDNIFSKEKSKIQANLKEGLLMAYNDGIFPFAENWCDHFGRGLGLPADEWFELNYSHLSVMQKNDKEDAEESNLQANAIYKLVTAGFSKEEAYKIVMKA